MNKSKKALIVLVILSSLTLSACGTVVFPSQREIVTGQGSVVEEDRTVAKEVKLGISDDRHYAVLSGISEGDQVITGPFKLLNKDLKNDHEWPSMALLLDSGSQMDGLAVKRAVSSNRANSA